MKNTRPYTSEKALPHLNRLCQWIISASLPLSLVNNDYFQEFIHHLNPQFRIPCDKTIKVRIFEEHHHAVNHLRSLINRTAESISLTTDLWTSRAQESYIGITASWLSNDFQLCSVTLDVRELRTRHTADNIRTALEETIEAWNLKEKVLSITTDNEKSCTGNGFGFVDRLCCTHTSSGCGEGPSTC